MIQPPRGNTCASSVMPQQNGFCKTCNHQTPNIPFRISGCPCWEIQMVLWNTLDVSENEVYPPKRLNCHFKKELVGKFRKIMINQSMDFLQSMILRQTTWIHLAPWPRTKPTMEPRPMPCATSDQKHGLPNHLSPARRAVIWCSYRGYSRNSV